MSDNQETDMYSRRLEKAQKELKDKDDLIIILKMKLNGARERIKERDVLIKEAMPYIEYLSKGRLYSNHLVDVWIEKAEKIK